MSRKTLEEFLCNSCGAEYTIAYVEEDILQEPSHCPFCGNELDNYDIEKEFLKQLNFEDDD